MPRGISLAMIAELSAPNPRFRVFFEAEFASGWVRVWSGVGDKVWNGNTWNGVGALGKISPITETGELRAEGIVAELSGIPIDLAQLALDECRPNKAARVWFGALDEDGNVIADPLLAFQGLMDVPTLTEGGSTCSISITIESNLADFQRPRLRRYTDQDQQQLYPGDKFFEYVSEVAANADGIFGKGQPMPGPVRIPGVDYGDTPDAYGPGIG